MLMRTTLRIDDGIARAAKSHAARAGITFTALIEQALRETLERRRSPAGPVDLPVDGADGKGPWEGIDLASNRALLEAMEEPAAGRSAPSPRT